MYDFQATAITGHCHILKDFLGVGAVRIDVYLFNAFIADLTIVLSHLFDESLASLLHDHVPHLRVRVQAGVS